MLSTLTPSLLKGSAQRAMHPVLAGGQVTHSPESGQQQRAGCALQNYACLLPWGRMWVQLLPGRRRLWQALADTHGRPCSRPVMQGRLLLIKQDLLHVLQGWKVSQPGVVWQVCVRAGPQVWHEGRRLQLQEVSTH